jgi:hypothetical protein
LYASPFLFSGRVTLYEGQAKVDEQLINVDELQPKARERQTNDWERQQHGALRWSTNGERKANGWFTVIPDANLLESLNLLMKSHLMKSPLDCLVLNLRKIKIIVPFCPPADI